MKGGTLGKGKEEQGFHKGQIDTTLPLATSCTSAESVSFKTKILEQSMKFHYQQMSLWR